MLVTGTVKENWNAKQPGWLKAEYAVGESGKCLSDWMPVMTGYAGDGYGRFQLPEIGSRVVVGFFQDDEDQPFVLGCLEGQSNSVAKEAASQDNEKKVLRSKNGYELELDEKKEIFSGTDPKGENHFIFNAKEGTFALHIKTGMEILVDGESLVKLEKNKISIRDKVTVSDDLEVKAAKISMEADGDWKIKGQNVAVEGTSLKAEAKQMKFKGTQWKAEAATLELKAEASGKLEAGGILEVKGAMLKLN